MGINVFLGGSEIFMQMGLLHMYMGEGKGKTTAALGLAMRAAGAGKKVIFAQFMKGGATGELLSLEKLENIRVMRCEKQFPFYHQMSSEQKKEQRKLHDDMLTKLLRSVKEKDCAMVVLDEITYPWQWELVDTSMLLALFQCARDSVEVVCTGRHPDPWLMEHADYITEMREIKHPYKKGIGARQGIEY